MNKGMVWVKWLDHSGHSGWQTREDAKKIQDWVCETLGWIIEENDKYLVLASSQVVVQDRVCDTTSIIKNDILDRRDLRLRALKNGLAP